MYRTRGIRNVGQLELMRTRDATGHALRSETDDVRNDVLWKWPYPRVRSFFVFLLVSYHVLFIINLTCIQRRYAGLWRPNEFCDYWVFIAYILRQEDTTYYWYNSIYKALLSVVLFATTLFFVSLLAQRYPPPRLGVGREVCLSLYYICTIHLN